MLRLNRLVRMLALLLLALMISPLHANTISVDAESERIDLSARMEMLRDSQQRLSYSDVIARPTEFRPAMRQDLVTSFNAGAFWLRVTLKNDSAYPLQRWLAVGSAKTQRVVLYLQLGETLQVLQSGRTIAVQDRPVDTMEPVFPIKLMPGEQQTLLLRVDARGATDMAPTLWEPQAYRHAEGRRQMQLAAILSGLLVSATLAFMVFSSVRETPYFWLGLFLTSIAGLEAIRSNFLGTYLWPGSLAQPGWMLAAFALGALFSISKVASHVLDLPHWQPYADLLLRFMRWIAVAGGAVALVSYGIGLMIMSAASVIINIAILLLALWAWIIGRQSARFFLLAFSIALLTEITRQLANLGILPWIAAMEFSTLFFLLASPLILLGLADQTRKLTEQLRISEQLQQAKSAFFARISHELRSPLNSILGFNRMLARGSAKLSLSEGTAGIEQSTLRLLQLIDELLDEARAATGQLSISPAPLQLRPWLDDIARTARINAEAKGNQLVCAFSGELPGTIHADGERLRQVLENLLSNANRHTRRGAIHFECMARVNGRDAILDFAIEDTGTGIAPERLPHIFEPFVHGHAPAPDPGRHGSGYGLGLSICRELLRQMSSDIEVASQLGQGSRFAFSLHCPILAQQASPSQDTPAPSSALPSVLLVDDDAAQLAELSEWFEQAGFAVACAHDGQTALDRMAEAEWETVITDQMMPGIDGWSLLHRLRARGSSAPVILFSSAAPQRPDGIPLSLDFDAILLKPATPEALLATVWRLQLRDQTPDSAPDWETLARLSREGEISEIEDWIAARRSNALDEEPLLKWLEACLYRLQLSLLERFAALIGKC